MTDADDPSESYEVGFGRPPKNTQFQKGVSGNPLGRRPQGAPSDSSGADELTTTYDIGFKQPPRSTQFRKGVSGNPYGRKAERHFVESILSKVLFSATAPTAATRSRACTNLEAMVRAMVMKALEGDVVAFREVMEWICEFGIGMESRLAARKLSLELQSHLLEARKR
ncbi:MAG TPA: DUF5681 domain-containing protein [Geothrix sp.]|nr:DUF5681 domain-containing protein [Geothrix sp.]